MLVIALSVWRWKRTIIPPHSLNHKTTNVQSHYQGRPGEHLESDDNGHDGWPSVVHVSGWASFEAGNCYETQILSPLSQAPDYGSLQSLYVPGVPREIRWHG